ncbi:hypothetical protein L1887_34180 [Cichorium endivia]|nr:hypothetical protein L1887_34180 [Cichorium endivia]
MSVNQSKGNNNESQQYRRSGRSGSSAPQRNFSGGGGVGKGGGGGSTTAPPSSSFNSGKSFKKVVSNPQGAPNRVQNPNVNLAPSNPSTVGKTAQNGAHNQPPLRGTPDASSTGPTDASVQKSTPGLPKAPQSNAVPSGSNPTGAAGPATPVKGSTDASRAFPLQFGSISPGVMNGMQVPPRTNSAPPNLDEQKRVQVQAQAQARLDSLKATSFQNPPVPKPRKDGSTVDQSNASVPHSTPKEKREVLSSSTPIKPSGPPMPSIPNVSMQIPFHQSQNYLQFGGPNPPLQSQPMVNTSMPVPLPMHLPVGNPPFVPGIQHHPMSSQGMIHQNQGLNFTPQMGPLGNMGMGMGPQYQQQQMGNFGGTRRTVKITHPDTHEELRLDKRTDVFPNGAPSGPRSHPHGPPSFPTPHPMNYYPNSYNASPIFYPPPGANPPGSQAPRFYNQQASKQVTVKPAVSAHVEKVGDSPAMDKSEIPKIQKPGGEGTATHPRKDSEVVAGISSPEPAPTPVATSSKAPASSVAIEDTTSLGKKGQSVLSSSVGHHGDDTVQETLKSSTLSSETNKDELEVSKKIDSDEKGLVSTEVIGSGTHSDMSNKVEGPVVDIVKPKEESKESVDQNQDRTVETVKVSLVTTESQQKEPLNDSDVKSSVPISTSDINVLSTETSLLNLGSSEKSPNLDNEPHAVSVSVPETSPLTLEVEGSIDKAVLETGKVKGSSSSTPKGKKKIKEILKNADARGSTSDLYNAYKRPEEKKETSPSEIIEPSSDITTKQEPVDLSKKDVKFEPDDWEDAADISAPKLEQVKHNSQDDNDGMTKKYSRDFLLKFSEQCTDLPEGFEVTTDIAEVLMGSSIGISPHPSPRPGAGPRLDRRSSNVGEDDKWNKGSGSMGPGRDMRVDPGYNVSGFRGNHGVLRTPRPQPPGYSGGILSGPIQSPGQQGYRNNSDSDRWQRASGYQKGLIPSPTPMPVMHKAERKYEVGKITDEEQAKQRQLKGILNKLTPQNFEKLFEQVKQVNIDNAGTLSGVINQIFDKALMEPTFVEMYANFCSRLAVELPDFSEDNEKITFKRLLLNKCQEEFERGEREQAEANRTDDEGEVKQTEEQREEKRVQVRRRMLGNIRLIGELYKKKMLTERIMHDCIKKLFGEEYQNPDEENIESLCKLMSTIGEMIDHAKAKEFMDVYFDWMFKLSNNMNLSSRLRFMLKDVIDLRKNRWQQRRKVEGPKKIEEVHRDAANERQAQSNRLARGPNPNTSLRRGQGQGQGQPMDFGPKGSNILPNPQTGYRGLPQQNRGYGNQDSRFEERHSFVPLRPVGDDSITLGPQGGLARGMSVRGQPPMRGSGGPNGYGSVPGYGPREDLGPRYSPRPTYEPEHVVPPPRGRVTTPPQSGPSDKVLSEDRLHDLSIEAIKEFYSARDEKEIALCVKDLNAPGFYPTMVSIWVTDSFERKDMDRESLAKLLINLTKSQEIISQDSLVKGFESVLSTLEDAVNDAPKAAEFLGRIFARVILENVIPYKEISRLIYEGGEEQGRLVEIGLGAEVVGVILEIVKSEKGDSFLNDLRASSNPRLENFRSANIKKASRLDKFI